MQSGGEGGPALEGGTASDNIAHTLRIYAGKGKAADTNSCVKNAEKVSVTVQSDDTLLFKYKDNNATEVKIEGRRSIAIKLL